MRLCASRSEGDMRTAGRTCQPLLNAEKKPVGERECFSRSPLTLRLQEELCWDLLITQGLRWRLMMFACSRCHRGKKKIHLSPN
ncbi:hypothetical protein WMY93_006424 [Mugilogobius chulae]|uniref:Uncharacterized protein n=1 Tax=Mugilogobius chulae TaxID=88201 RepID=A0AAW0PN66_9GOBI